MRTFLLFALSWVLAAANVDVAHAQPGLPTQFPMILMFNENCMGFWTMDSQFVPLDCTIEPDPLSGLPVPTFFLPQPVVPGDVVIVDPDGTPADVIRFPADPVTGLANTMLYFSDIDPTDPNPPPSDMSGLPPNIDPNAIVINEMGAFEVFDSFSYSPDGITFYLGISDSP
jgi:hypothetical protein